MLKYFVIALNILSLSSVALAKNFELKREAVETCGKLIFTPDSRVLKFVNYRTTNPLAFDVNFGSEGVLNGKKIDPQALEQKLEDIFLTSDTPTSPKYIDPIKAEEGVMVKVVVLPGARHFEAEDHPNKSLKGKYFLSPARFAPYEIIDFQVIGSDACQVLGDTHH